MPSRDRDTDVENKHIDTKRGCGERVEMDWQISTDIYTAAAAAAAAVAAAAKSLQSCPTLCDPIDGSPPGFLSMGFCRQEYWSG